MHLESLLLIGYIVLGEVEHVTLLLRPFRACVTMLSAFDARGVCDITGPIVRHSYKTPPSEGTSIACMDCRQCRNKETDVDLMVGFIQ